MRHKAVAILGWKRRQAKVYLGLATGKNKYTLLPVTFRDDPYEEHQTTQEDLDALLAFNKK